MVNGLLWDNDGVLVDTERLYFEVNRDFFRRHGIELTETQFFDWFLLANVGVWPLLEQRGLGPREIEELRRGRNECYRQRLQAADGIEVPGIRRVLERLAHRVRMGIVTSARRDHFETMHRPLGLLPFFEFALTSEMYAESKPAPEPYLLGLARLGLPAGRCLAIEDSPRGLQSATAAGLRCVVLRNPMTAHHEFPGAYRVVESADELLAAIEEAP